MASVAFPSRNVYAVTHHTFAREVILSARVKSTYCGISGSAYG